MNNLHPNLWIILIVAGLSFLQWAARKAKEQQVRNERKRAQQRAYEESLRTGRSHQEERAAPKPSQHDVQQARLRELAEMRRRQLEELRRQQREAAVKKRSPSVRMPSTPGGTTSPSRLPTAGPVSSGTIVQPGSRRAGQGGGAPARPTAPSKRSSDRTPPARAPRPRATTATVTTPGGKPEPAGMSRLASVKGSEIGAEPVAMAKPQAPPVDWRRAIILSEVLGSPLALRNPGEDTDRAW